LTSLAGRLGYRNGSHGGFYEERNTLLPGGRYWDRISDLLGVNSRRRGRWWPLGQVASRWQSEGAAHSL
jgi:hypothetical protein